MENETLPVTEIKPLPVPELRRERVLYALITIVLPIICFCLSFALEPEWQSGRLSDYAKLMLLAQDTWFFFPFLLYSVACLFLLLIAPERFAGRFVVRFGVYTGVMLALQYTILALATDFALLCAGSAGFLILAEWGSRRIKPGWRVGYFTLLTIIVFSIGIVLWRPSLSLESLQPLFMAVPFGALIAILAAAPILCLVVMALTSIKLIKYYETKMGSMLVMAGSLVAWLAAYAVAWRFSILQAIEVYHSLPASPPDCYIATASTRGHRRFVRSWPVATPYGTMWATQQLQILKCAELALMALAPRFHSLLRWVYDRLGPPLARRLVHPFLADLAYLALKPFERAAWLLLRAIIPEIDKYTGQLYRET